jgi:hypothetical protein
LRPLPQLLATKPETPSREFLLRRNMNSAAVTHRFAISHANNPAKLVSDILFSLLLTDASNTDLLNKRNLISRLFNGRFGEWNWVPRLGSMDGGLDTPPEAADEHRARESG